MVTHYNYIENKLQTQSELREGLLSKELEKIQNQNESSNMKLSKFKLLNKIDTLES